MKKTKIIAFWDLLICSIISLILFTMAIYIFIVVKGNNGWNDIGWFYALIFAFCIAIPFTSMLCLQKITIDLSCDKVNLFYLVNLDKNDRDITTNWNIFPSEIQSAQVVKLSKEEKRKYTSAHFLFSKYLKITMKYGNVKYVYISHYSNNQIFKIKDILVNRHCYR